MDDVIDDNYKNRQIFVFSQIDSYSAQYIVRELLAMDRKSSEEITMFINSPGGSVYQMFAIIDTMKIIKSPVRTVVIGIAASAAACLASAGKTRLISPTGQVMIHEASAGAFGSVSSMQETLEQVAKQQEIMINMLAKNTNKSVSQIKEVINKTDKYFTAQEAMAFGIVDRIISDNEAQALKLSESINVEGYEISGKEIQLLREGKYFHPVYGAITLSAQILELMKKNFDDNVRGCDVSIDYTHDNENGESPAAFWIKSLEVRQNSDGKGKGLFAQGEFTPMGAKKVSEKEYRYSSADFVIDYIDQNAKHHPYVLRGGTLTNRPFVKNMNPIKLSETFKKEIKQMSKEELMAALKECGIDVTSLLGQVEASNSRTRELEAKIVELNALPAQKEEEIKALKDKLAEINSKIVSDEKLSAFNDLVSQGKCVPAQKEAIISAFSSASDIVNFFKDAPKVVSMKAAGTNTEGVDEELTAEEKALVDGGMYTKEAIIAGRSPVKKETTA